MKKKTNEQLIVELQQQVWSLMNMRHQAVTEYQLERMRDQIKESLMAWNIFLVIVFVFMLAVTYG